jgi:hypothetical protein
MSCEGSEEGPLPQEKEPEEYSFESSECRTLKAESEIGAAKCNGHSGDGKGR